MAEGMSGLWTDARPVLLGAGGMLHRAWRQLLDGRGVKYDGLGRQELDLRDAANIGRVIGECRVVINCAAYTDVDGAEKAEGLANEVNGTGVGSLARVCRERGAVLVHYST
ncbi:MAG TPA: sugar nucleotide-binding protein, partial [Tepidisphaeraceae bacterium]|nr:sugar nucleotide-binding protein [Tepidisphaeraceae bacterium]